MAAQIIFDQTGIPAGAAGKARDDGLDTGVTVTVTNGSGQPCTCHFWWKPPDDSGAALSQVGPSQWEFTPTALRYGSYTVVMIEAAGTDDETIDIKDFGIRLPNSNLLIPGMNGRADPDVNLDSSAADKTTAAAAAYNNVTNAEGLDWVGWWQSMRELYEYVDTVTGASIATIGPGTLEQLNAAISDSDVLGMTVLVPPALIAGTTDDYAPTSVQTSHIFMVTPDATNSALSGFVAPTGTNIVRWIYNLHATARLTLLHDVDSAAGNRFSLPDGQDLILDPGEGVQLFYYDTGTPATSFWRAVEQANFRSDGAVSMRGDINMGGNSIVSVNTVDGVDVSAHAARHLFNAADEIDADQLGISWVPSNYTRSPGGSSGAATDNEHLASHLVGIDTVAGAFFARDWKDSCRVASTVDIDLTTGGLLTVDGVTLVANDRVLVKDQSAAAENGIYLVNAGAWTRAADANNGTRLNGGMAAYIVEGTVNAGRAYVLTTSGTISVGSTALAFDALHGDLDGGTLHAVATTSTPGFMSAEDKEKLEPVIDFAISTTNATPVTAGTIPITDDSVMRVYCELSCKDGSGNRAVETVIHRFHRVSAGGATILGSQTSLETEDDTAGVGGIGFDVSGNSGVVEFTGLAGNITGRLKVWAREEVD